MDLPNDPDAMFEMAKRYLAARHYGRVTLRDVTECVWQLASMFNVSVPPVERRLLLDLEARGLLVTPTGDEIKLGTLSGVVLALRVLLRTGIEEDAEAACTLGWVLERLDVLTGPDEEVTE